MQLRMRSVVMRRRRRVWVKIGIMIRVRRRVSIGVWNKIKIGVKANRTHISGNKMGVGIMKGVRASPPESSSSLCRVRARATGRFSQNLSSRRVRVRVGVRVLSLYSIDEAY